VKRISFLFGKPCEKDGSFKAKYFRFYYWFMVVFITISLAAAVIICFFNASMIPVTILVAIILPLFSRLFYSVSLKVQGLKREK